MSTISTLSTGVLGIQRGLESPQHDASQIASTAQLKKSTPAMATSLATLQAYSFLFAVFFCLCSPNLFAGGVVVAGKQPPSKGAKSQIKNQMLVTSNLYVGNLFTIPPSTPTLVSRENRLYFWVEDLQTGAVIPNSSIWLSNRAGAFSGGHNHDDPSRPAGQFVPSSGNTGSDGYLRADYIAPEVSGEIHTTLTCAVPDGTCDPAYFLDYVMVPNLEPMPEGFDLNGNPYNHELIGQRAVHYSDHYYGRPALIQTLILTADQFALLYPGSVLQYNDLSLPWGGLFDYDANLGVIWAPGHRGHRFGNDADFNHRAVPASQRDELKKIMRNGKLKIKTYPDDSHWHLTLNY